MLIVKDTPLIILQNMRYVMASIRIRAHMRNERDQLIASIAISQ